MKQSYKRITALFLAIWITAYFLVSCSSEVAEKPNEEEVFAALSEASKEAMDLFYAEYWDRTRCGYFFDENCSIAILNGEMSYDEAGVPIYTATVETKRSWKYVDVTETETMNFIYDSESGEWKLDDYVIENVVGKWHVDGEYQGEDGCSFLIETGEYVSGGSEINYEEFDFMLANYQKSVFSFTDAIGDTYVAECVELKIPCSKGILGGAGSFATDDTHPKDPVHTIVTVYPEEIFYVDHMSPTYKKNLLS